MADNNTCMCAKQVKLTSVEDPRLVVTLAVGVYGDGTFMLSAMAGNTLVLAQGTDLTNLIEALQEAQQTINRCKEQE